MFTVLLVGKEAVTRTRSQSWHNTGARAGVPEADNLAHCRQTSSRAVGTMQAPNRHLLPSIGPSKVGKNNNKFVLLSDRNQQDDTPSLLINQTRKQSRQNHAIVPTDICYPNTKARPNWKTMRQRFSRTEINKMTLPHRHPICYPHTKAMQDRKLGQHLASDLRRLPTLVVVCSSYRPKTPMHSFSRTEINKIHLIDAQSCGLKVIRFCSQTPQTLRPTRDLGKNLL